MDNSLDLYAMCAALNADSDDEAGESPLERVEQGERLVSALAALPALPPVANRGVAPPESFSSTLVVLSAQENDWEAVAKQCVKHRVPALVQEATRDWAMDKWDIGVSN
jgi:hypothetical protein